MNYWTKLSIEYANQRSYLDDLFKIYPTIPNGIRDIDNDLWNKVELFYKQQDNTNLIRTLLKMDSTRVLTRHFSSGLRSSDLTVSM